jgi:hypothetical protein
MALVLGLFMLVVGGIVQFGMIFWSQNAVTEIARDTARWAVTQSASPCDSAASRAGVAATANQLAVEASLINHNAGEWSTAPAIGSLGPEGVGVDWPVPPPPPDLFASDCPPSDNAVSWNVRVQVNHVVPIFIPGLQLISSCGGSGFCVSSMTELRMEPKNP